MTNVISGGRTRLTIYDAQVYAAVDKSTLPSRIDMAYEVALEAIDIAPVVSGAYRDGIDVVTEGTDVFIVDDDPIAFMKEFGTVDTEPIGLLTEAAQVLAKYNSAGAFGKFRDRQ